MNLYEAVVIGVSAGGFQALPVVLSPLPADFPAAVVVVQHVGPSGDQVFFVEHLGRLIQMKVREAMEREPVAAGTIYIAPAGYHLLIEDERTFSLSSEARVNYSRPAIDVLFESAARAYGARLIGVILTGANDDGAAGLKAVQTRGGLTVVQDPATAESAVMPAAAAVAADHVMSLADIAAFLIDHVPPRTRQHGPGDHCQRDGRGERPLPGKTQTTERK